MIHYHVWFNLKSGVPEADGLAAVSEFLRQLCRAAEASTFQLLRNNGEPPKSRLPKYHALVEFIGSAQLSTAMRNQAARGIHEGAHGFVIDVVTDFHVEIFTRLDGFERVSFPLGAYACEI
jgi:hypothetical protein